MIYYVAHPLGTGEARVANLARVKRWLAWLIKEYPRMAFCVPWVAYAESMGDQPEDHKRGLRDDLTILERCDGIVLCGGELSPGMRAEFMHYCKYRGMKHASVNVHDFLTLGPEPPPV